MSLNSQKGPYKEPPLYDKEPKSIDPYVVVISVTFTLIFFIVFVWIIGYCVKMSMEKSKARREQRDTNNPQNYAATTNANANENYRVAVTNHLLQVCIKFLIFFFFAIIKIFKKQLSLPISNFIES